jgi:hypothetical protein
VIARAFLQALIAGMVCRAGSGGAGMRFDACGVRERSCAANIRRPPAKYGAPAAAAELGGSAPNFTNLAENRAGGSRKGDALASTSFTGLVNPPLIRLRLPERCRARPAEAMVEIEQETGGGL